MSALQDDGSLGAIRSKTGRKPKLTKAAGGSLNDQLHATIEKADRLKKPAAVFTSHLHEEHCEASYNYLEYSRKIANVDRLSERNELKGSVDSATKPAARAPRHPLPELPSGLHWPADFDQADEFGRYPKAKGGIVAYLDREWKAIIAAKKIDMPTLRENFPKAAAAINDYTKPTKTRNKRTLPTELAIPVIAEVNSQKLARTIAGQESVDAKEARRLGSALARRLASGRLRLNLPS